MSFSSEFVNRRTSRRQSFLMRINQIIDWKPIEKIINSHYSKGKSLEGRPCYDGILLFKMCLLQTWYSLSDYGVEDYVNENLTAMRFCGLELEDTVPDHSVISRFRSEMSRKGVMDKLLKEVNRQLESKHLMVKNTVVTDASITETPFKPKGKSQYELEEKQEKDDKERKDNEDKGQEHGLVRKMGKGVDKEARYTVKSNTIYFGYKRHHVVDLNGLILKVHTTAANVHDGKQMSALIKGINTEEEGIKAVVGDKAYRSSANEKLLKRKGLRNLLQYKGYRNRPLQRWQKEFNKRVSRIRYIVERGFGSIKRWFGGGVCRYKGLIKTHGQHIMEAIAYNLKISIGLVLKMQGN